LSDLDLSAYTSIILVDGSYEKVSVAAGSALLQWTKNGGRLIAIQRGAEWVVEQDIVEAEFVKEEEEEDVPWVRFADRETVKQARLISGAIFQIDLDTSHPIAFGYKKRIPVFKNRYSVLKPATKTGTTVAVYPVDPLVSGYAPADRVASLKETAAITSNEVEDGRVILIQDVPTFRAFWYGTDALLLNAIMFAEAY